MTDHVQAEIGTALRAARNILIVSHSRPDGDSIGSLLALGLSLQETGSVVQMVSGDGVPANFRHLAGTGSIIKKPNAEYDLAIFVDCSDPERVGDVLEKIERADINIDHHTTNEHFAQFNLVDVEAVSTTAIIFQLLKRHDFPITEPVAAALLTGLLTDTLGFMTSNVTPEALRLAAELMEFGASLPDLYRKAMQEKSFEAMRYWGAGLSVLERDRGLIWTSLTLKDREAINYPGRDDADLINQLSNIRDGDVRLIFIEQKGEKVKVSWRSRVGFDVSEVARQFGGGGHRQASGAMIPGELEDVRSRVLQATKFLLKNTESTPN